MGLDGRKRSFGGYGAVSRVFNVLIVLLLLGPALAGSGHAAGKPVRILAFGDSLTAGYGLAPAEGFTAQLETALKARGHDVQVINGGVSGDTTAGGAARLDWALGDAPDLVILELGANDALRGLDPAAARRNLDRMLATLAGRGIPTLLAGMYAPPNFGRDYGERFNAIYPELAAKHGVPLFPFFLEGVAARPDLNQPDGIHPNAAGVRIIVETLLPHLLPLVERAQG